MKRKHIDRNSILLDLTPLLDVIFIMLIIFVADSALAGAESERMISENAIVKEEYDLRNETLDEYYTFVDVISTYDADAPESRTVSIYEKPDEPKLTIQLEGNDVEEKYGELEEALKIYVEGNKGKPVVFALNQDDEKILYRDEKRIEELFDKMKDLSDDVYIK